MAVNSYRDDEQMDHTSRKKIMRRLLGYLLGLRFADAVHAAAPWIAFILLALIGGNMIREALGKEEEEEWNNSFGPKAMIPLALATSIDALAVGVTFAFLITSR